MQFSTLDYAHSRSNSRLEHFILWDSAAKSVTSDATDAIVTNTTPEIPPYLLLLVLFCSYAPNRLKTWFAQLHWATQAVGASAPGSGL